jgi:hypothetical protein
LLNAKQAPGPAFRAKRVGTADREIRAAQQSRSGAPVLPEVLNLSSARCDRGAKPFLLWGTSSLPRENSVM